MASSITLNELKSFHLLDRKLYFRLAVKLGRNPIMTIKVIALWIWLEACGYEKMVLKLLGATDKVVNFVADEAVICLNYMENGNSIRQRTLEEFQLPESSALLGRRLSLVFFLQQRDRALSSINIMINGNLTRALLDIVQAILGFMERAMSRSSGNANATGRPLDMSLGFLDSVGPSLFNPRMSVNFDISASPSYLNQRMNMNMNEGTTRQVIQHQHALHGVSVGRAVLGSSHVKMVAGPSQRNMSAGSSHLNPTAQPWIPNNGVHQQERTMFITFSKGYPVSAGELRSFFLGTYGDVVDLIQMDESSTTQQPLYAVGVFRDASMIPLILEGEQTAKFVINGKHVWMRKYIPKNVRG